MPWFDCAVHKPIGANTGGPLEPNLGLVLHHAVANGSLFNFFNNPASQVSAHFWVALDGRIEQYVNTGTIAWHAMELNQRYVGVETEGCTTPPYAQPMTDLMVKSLATLYAEGRQRHGWPLGEANADGQPGFGYHRMAINTACPCDVRLAMRPTILQLAGNIISPPQPPPVKIPKGETISVEQLTINGKEYVVSNIVANGHLVQVRQDLDSIGQPSNGQNTSIIDLTNQWPGELPNVTAG